MLSLVSISFRTGISLSSRWSCPFVLASFRDVSFRPAGTVLAGWSCPRVGSLAGTSHKFQWPGCPVACGCRLRRFCAFTHPTVCTHFKRWLFLIRRGGFPGALFHFPSWFVVILWVFTWFCPLQSTGCAQFPCWWFPWFTVVWFHKLTWFSPYCLNAWPAGTLFVLRVGWVFVGSGVRVTLVLWKRYLEFF